MADNAAPAVSQLAGKIYEAIGKETEKIAAEQPYCRYVEPDAKVRERMLAIISAALSEREELISRLLVHWDRNEIDLHYACSEAETSDIAEIFNALALGS
jgi:hypothetical protein